MNLSRMSSNKQLKENAGISNDISLELGRIDYVDKVKSSCKVYIFKQSALLNDVRIAFAYANSSNGLVKLPEAGSLCLVLTDKKQQSFVINYLPSKEFTEDNGLADLLEFSYILKGDNGSMVELSKYGDVSVSSDLLNALILEQGISMISSTKDISTQNYKRSDTTKPTPNIKEYYYDEKINSLLSSSELADKILLEEEVEIEERDPLITIQKVNALDGNGDVINLDINTDPGLSKEVCYKLNINGTFEIIINKGGSMSISGDKLVFNFDTVDFSQCNNITGIV